MARKYRVISRTPTLGHSQGEVFSADLNKEQEARLLARGALERVKRNEEQKDAESTRSKD